MSSDAFLFVLIPNMNVINKQIKQIPKRIVVLGGGTGTFTALSGLKYHPVDLSAAGMLK